MMHRLMLSESSLCYADLVDDQHGTVRKVLAFIGEEFTPGCLALRHNRRYARTASYAQVREAITALLTATAALR
jgi:hypothetical protein